MICVNDSEKGSNNSPRRRRERRGIKKELPLPPSAASAQQTVSAARPTKTLVRLAPLSKIDSNRQQYPVGCHSEALRHAQDKLRRRIRFVSRSAKQMLCFAQHDSNRIGRRCGLFLYR